MAISREDVRLLQKLFRPLAQRVTNMVARGVVRLVNDGKKLQLLQVGGFPGGPIDGAAHYQPYGFSSSPLAGAEAVVLFPSGDRERPIVVAVSDRRHRPTGGKAGEVTMYSHTGARARMLENGDIELYPAPGREVLIHQEGGVTGPLATLAELEALRAYVSAQFAATGGHTHAVAGAATTAIITVPSVPDPLPAPQPVPPTVLPPVPSGTTVLKAE